MKRKNGLITVAAVLLCLAFFVLFYTRPRTIEQRYPFLKMVECVQISGYYRFSDDDAPHSFSISPDDEKFDEMLRLFREVPFKTRLRNILPLGTRTHTGDGFQWNVDLTFESITLDDGSSISGDVLNINNFYGDIVIFFNGEIVQCKVSEPQQWAQNVLDIAQLFAD